MFKVGDIVTFKWKDVGNIEHPYKVLHANDNSCSLLRLDDNTIVSFAMNNDLLRKLTPAEVVLYAGS